jgi:ABC-type nitrate/sulfonate/bicarbonate transport system substrate-binding protein
MFRRSFSQALALAALGAALVLPAAAADKVRIGKSVPFSWTFTPLEIGLEAGIFAKHGIELTVSSFGGDARMQQALTADSLDMGVGSGPGLGFMGKGVPAKGVAAMASEPRNIAAVVYAASPYKTLDDLKGKKIGVTTVGSLTDWLAQQAAIQRGWGQNGVTVVPVGGMETSRAALKTGQIDALLTAVEAGYALEETKEWRVVQNMAVFAPDFHTHVIFARDDMIKDRPDVIRRVLKGWFETIAFMRANKDKTVEVSAKVLKLDPKVIARAYDEEIHMFSADGKWEPKAMEVLKKSFIDMKILETVPNDSDLITTQFVPVTR